MCGLIFPVSLINHEHHCMVHKAQRWKMASLEPIVITMCRMTSIRTPLHTKTMQCISYIKPQEHKCHFTAKNTHMLLQLAAHIPLAMGAVLSLSCTWGTSFGCEWEGAGL